MIYNQCEEEYFMALVQKLKPCYTSNLNLKIRGKKNGSGAKIEDR
jgi:hypothetical protein